MVAYLPAYEGFLPYWLLFISLLAVQNTVQGFFTTRLAQKVYHGSASTQITPLSVRTYGTWTFLSGIIRVYAAYNIHDPHLYTLALLTYFIVLGHFGSEWLVFGTARLNSGLLSVLIPATTSVVWMLMQRNFYLK